MAPDRKDITSSYHAYFTSGHYDRRYPSPNKTTWQRICDIVSPSTHLVDFGCGSGRYLLRLQGKVAQAAGFDISPAAIALLKERAAQIGWDDLAILGPAPDALQNYIERVGEADVVLCLFGVLGHIEDAQVRHDALRQMHRALKPETGRLLISVPNMARRFFAEQRVAGPDAGGAIHYERRMDGTHVVLPYQLFDPARLCRELAAAGFELRSLKAESVLPESWLLNNALARWVDSVLTPFCPARWGYGIIALAVPA
ncbi:bifunctional 2-polyprenyl-6-hydroxyphenol methylase/3-demethylubiquinol 3-O-methyltransferase UbiG [uncultured Roseobacter sp.]|uniref:class I SAM-dependent methyltransferase n=1 Tax=uncultured Roseobacter sp. TaxID=114847 RepID=UPI00263439CB|nr:class I SAM-dependent methyltransferase [uncultured Roseobacter sp.]